MITEFNASEVIGEAIRAGQAAHDSAVPIPMGVTDGRQTWVVNDGVCGFAWVNVHGVRSNSKVGKALIANGFRKSDYEKCLQFWVHTPNQSMDRKEAYARAFADVLTQHGIKAYPGSRMD